MASTQTGEARDQEKGGPLVTVTDAAAYLSLGRTKLYDLVRRGEVEAVKIGRVTRIPLEALDRYVVELRARSSW